MTIVEHSMNNPCSSTEQTLHKLHTRRANGNGYVQGKCQNCIQLCVLLYLLMVPRTSIERARLIQLVSQCTKIMVGVGYRYIFSTENAHLDKNS